MGVKSTTVYMAVQVVTRDKNGTLTEWYDGDMYGTLAEAKADAAMLAKENAGTPYSVVERRVTEIGNELKRPKTA